jgi:hypothetical protein
VPTDLQVRDAAGTHSFVDPARPHRQESCGS